MTNSISNLKTAAAFAAMAITLAAPAAAQKQDLSNPDSAFAGSGDESDWLTTITRTERGHRIGNPDADSRMIEFISYTCSHCANFTDEGEPGLELTLILPGRMNLEVRPVIRNWLDVTVTMLAQCGAESSFKDRHRMLMLSQDEWLGKAQKAPVSQQQVWARADGNARVNAANALGLLDMMAKAGQSRTQLTTCLVDDAAFETLLDNGKADRAEFAFSGTPSFALDGKLLANVHGWAALYTLLSERFGADEPSS
jgi:protein-disulfide isomerase